MKWNEQLPLSQDHLSDILEGLEQVSRKGSTFRFAVLRGHDASASHIFPALSLTERGIRVFKQDLSLTLQVQAHEVGNPKNQLIWSTTTQPEHPEYTPLFLFDPAGKVLAYFFLHGLATEKRPERWIASMSLFVGIQSEL